MVAMAYQFHSGVPLANDRSIQKQLIEKSIAGAHEKGAKYLEIRHFAPCPLFEEMGFVNIQSQLVTTTTLLQGLDLKTHF